MIGTIDWTVESISDLFSLFSDKTSTLLEGKALVVPPIQAIFCNMSAKKGYGLELMNMLRWHSHQLIVLRNP